MEIFEFLAEQAINKALEEGQFKNLKGSCEIIDFKQGDVMTEYLAKSGALPKEVMLMKKLSDLKENNGSRKVIRELELEINILKEKRLS